MASSQSTNGLSKQMEKMSVSGKSRADAPRYTPPHRKYAQANKSSESSTSLPARVTNQLPAATHASTESSVSSEATDSTGPEVATEDKTTHAAATDKAFESEPKPKPSANRIAPHHKPTKPAAKVADSWEEEALSDPESPNTSTSGPKTSTKTTEQPAPVPKSTYLPPHLKYRSAAPSPPSRSITPPSRSTTPSSSTSSDRRPEKTNAVAHRLIAGALGVKVPRRTEEQRAYDKAMREQEKRKRDQEREAKKKAEEDAARAKAAIWDD
ncbi:hypothetical protein E4T49_03018 [Aureobasidium sp. EXF-10728]|nr:hypothetical protein E4T49_03018 [Aureobasidium sp. EXF-10728]